MFTLFIVTISLTCIDAAVVGPFLNLTNFAKARERRALIFEGGGNIRLAIGPILPVNFGDPIAWRSLICAYNLQGGLYNIPTKPLYPWAKWEETFSRSMHKMRYNLDRLGQYRTDDTRTFVYTIVEKYMCRDLKNGRVCLLRSICQNSQVRQHAGLFAEILNILLTADNSYINSIYNEAERAGRDGVNCLQLYNACPMGANILDQYIDEF